MAVRSIVMSVDDFISVPDNPRQRDTEAHARKALRSHLRKSSPTHVNVSAAAIGGTVICKLDGHTRSLLWSTGKLSRPKSLMVTVYEVNSLEEAKELYTHFDNSSAAESSSDKLSGACREHGVTLRSGLFRKHDFNTALKFAHSLRATSSNRTEYELICDWACVLEIADSWMLPKNAFKGTGVVCLLLVAIASERFSLDKIESFAKKYAADEGRKEGARMDGVQALSSHITRRRLENQMTGYENIYDMTSRGYSCLAAWCQNQMITNVRASTEALTSCHAAARENIDSGKFRHN
jgi:hypothetical protein